MKLFVAKLNREAVESDLLEWFGAMGAVKSVKIVTDRDTGQSKCFGFGAINAFGCNPHCPSDARGLDFMRRLGRRRCSLGTGSEVGRSHLAEFDRGFDWPGWSSRDWGCDRGARRASVCLAR